MTTLADKAILSGANNRPPMLEKDMYDSWKSQMELYMINRQHIRMIVESVENGPLLWPTVEETRVTRPKKYSELSTTEAIQADCDVKATNIILQGLPPEFYALVRNHKVAKELWERIQLLMQGTSLTKQEMDCKLYDELDMFAYKKGESLLHHNVYNPSSSIPQVEYASSVHQQSDFSQPDTGLIVPVFQKGDDPIDAMNHMMSFLTVVVTSRYPPTNNQLRNSSNTRQQATINNGRVTVQPFQGRQNYLAAGVNLPTSASGSQPPGNVWPLTRITTTAIEPLKKPIPLESNTSKPEVVQIVHWYLDSGCSKHMTGDRSQLTNFVNKFLGTIKFGNDHVAKIMGYGDYKIRNVTISRVYFMEGLGHNLFSVGKFCDSDLEVAFHQHTCFIYNLEGVDLLTRSRGNNIYTLSLGDM
nr:integrase, catalytic region, zinc finger, CCHC-type, peptidase aspartic, catalytic [Tanacetum cinerariifolium]